MEDYWSATKTGTAAPTAEAANDSTTQAGGTATDAVGDIEML
jgi:hypothetical protein